MKKFDFPFPHISKNSHFFDDKRVLWFIVINDDASGTRHQGEYKSSDDADIWYNFFQTCKALTIDIKQQRHQTKGCDVGARGHNDAGRISNREETLFGWCIWNENVSNL